MNSKTPGPATVKYGSLNREYRMLLAEAKKIMKTGFNARTNSVVGAALLTQSGRIISASNVTPRDRAANICAERAVIAKANSLGERKFVAIAVIGNMKDKSPGTHVITSCGTCRSLLSEFAQHYGHDIDVIMSDAAMKNVVVCPISKLLPMAFV